MAISSVIHKLDLARKAVAFTFDDGPNPTYTPEVLEIFAKAGGKATFFMIGENIAKYPEVARAVAEQGHEIGNHTYTHPAMTKLSEQERDEEISKTDALIRDTVGRGPAVFRPPYFDWNEEAAKSVEPYGYAVIGAVNGEAKDWEQPGVQHIKDKTLAHMAPGSMLLFHDGFGDRSQSVQAVRELIDQLIAEGYELVTASELLAMAEQPR